LTRQHDYNPIKKKLKVKTKIEGWNMWKQWNWCRVGSGKQVTRLLVVFVGTCSGYPIINRVACHNPINIGSGSCQTRLCNRVSRVDTNPTSEPELPTLTDRWKKNHILWTIFGYFMWEMQKERLTKRLTI